MVNVGIVIEENELNALNELASVECQNIDCDKCPMWCVFCKGCAPKIAKDILNRYGKE